MALFNWGKKKVEDDFASETFSSYEEHMKKLWKAHEEAHTSSKTGGSITTTTGGSMPWATVAASAAASSIAGSAYSVPRGHIKLEHIYDSCGMEPLAVIQLAAYFAKLGVKTEADAGALIEELNSV